MPLVEPVIRPPSEAGSFLLQLTVGCSVNTCTFCGAYRGKPFRVKEMGEIEGDMAEWRRLAPETRRVFLLDGDALAAGRDIILPVLDRLGTSFPDLARVGSYANGSNITPLSDSELREYAAGKLKLFTIGLESGSQTILHRCRKKSGVEEMIEGVRRAAGAGIKSSVIVLLGLGGIDGSEEHVKGTIAALNAMQPRYLSFLSLMLIPGTALCRQEKRGEFRLPGPQLLLREAHDIIEGLELEKTVFRTDHASNHLPLEGRLPKDRAALLAALQSAMAGGRPLRREASRGL